MLMKDPGEGDETTRMLYASPLKERSPYKIMNLILESWSKANEK